MSAQTAKIAIVGGGAMGSVFAGLFAEAGHEVTIVSRPGAHMDAIRANGLRLDGASGDKTVQVRALDTSPSEEFDLVILAVKATQVEAAVGSLAPMMGEVTSILAMQNGLWGCRYYCRACGCPQAGRWYCCGFWGIRCLAGARAPHGNGGDQDWRLSWHD